MGHYVYGHPKVKSPAPDIVYGRLETGHIVFYQIGETEYNVFPPSAIEGFKILCNNIEDARVEDETTFESRITIPRMFVAGLYSLAWKKISGFCAVPRSTGCSGFRDLLRKSLTASISMIFAKSS